MKTGIRVGDAMTKKPVMVKPKITISECVKHMNKNDVGSVLVEENGKIKGVLTNTDIVTRVVATHKSPKDTKVEEVMSKNLTFVSPKKDMYEALVLMANDDIRRLPVRFKGKFVGLLTIKDILRVQPALFDIIVDHIDIREKREKISQGKCDACKSKNTIFRIGNKWLCDACK